MKKIHFISGSILTIFVCAHLFNHCYSVMGADKHIELMAALRYFYRNTFVEIILLLTVAIQIFSGLELFIRKLKIVVTKFEKLQIWTGLYLAIFFAIHLSAVLAGRLLFKLDTNYYFGVAGLNSFPFNLFFIPYYALAIMSFFGHIAALHNKKMKFNILGMSPNTQSIMLLIIGIVITIFIFYGLTNHFRGLEIPKEYNVLIGKK